MKNIESQFVFEVNRTEQISRQNEKLSGIKKRTKEKLSIIQLKDNL